MADNNKVLEAVRSIHGHPDRDWEEDFTHENGQYICHCCICDLNFIGYKRRAVCKSCAATPKAVSDALLSPHRLPEDELPAGASSLH